MKYCKKCVMPDTKPDLFFDKEGVCDACRSAEAKETAIDWGAREKELEEILEKHRNKDGSNYDCIVPVSGGKDSHFQTYIIKKKYLHICRGKENTLILKLETLIYRYKDETNIPR